MNFRLLNFVFVIKIIEKILHSLLDTKWLVTLPTLGKRLKWSHVKRITQHGKLLKKLPTFNFLLNFGFNIFRNVTFIELILKLI